MPDFPATDPLFLSTLSLRRATPRPSPSCHPVWDFYPRSPCGERPGPKSRTPDKYYFYPRSPYGERQQMEHLKIPAHGISIHALLAESDISVFWTALSRPLFLSTLSLRRATHYDNYNLHCVEISIHALLAESDLTSVVSSTGTIDFYPRSPCGERRYRSGVSVVGRSDFYPRSPCGERQT